MPKGSLGNIQQILINILKAQNPFYFFKHTQISINSTAFHRAKTRELGDATVKQPQPIMPFGIVAYALMLFCWTTFLETAEHLL